MISALSGLIATLKFALQSFSYLFKSRESIKSLFYSTHRSFFYKLSWVKLFVANNKELLKIEDRFINKYIRTAKERTVVKLPYHEIVNFITLKVKEQEEEKAYFELISPPQIIKIKQNNCKEKFKIEEKVEELTKNNLKEFREVKEKSGKPITKGPTLRIKSLEKNKCNSETSYTCELQNAHYFDQIRTNLTIDLPLVGRDAEESLREYDLRKSTNKKNLPEFKDSVLANTVGASAIWYTEVDPDDKSKKNINRLKDPYMIFLRPRNKGVGVFSNMFGTTSGVVEPPRYYDFHGLSLEEYVKYEMLREFFYESNYKGLGHKLEEMLENKETSWEKIKEFYEKALTDLEIEIKPLAFTRDLIRGGKPQFFFIIKTPPVEEGEVRENMKVAPEGFEEFEKMSLLSFLRCKLSPETHANLLYALQYLQRLKPNDYILLKE